MSRPGDEVPRRSGKPVHGVRRFIRDLASQAPHPYVRRLIAETPSTGHAEGNSLKMVREVNNWPHAWMPEHSPARTLLKQAIARGDAYVYYPIGSSRPVIYYHDRRYDLGEFQQRFG